MIALDTNVLVRIITLDDKQQSQAAQQLLNRYKGQPRSIYINHIVLCELCWLLKSGYHYSKKQISEVLQLILNVEEFEFSNRRAIFEAVLLFKDHSGDFADYLVYSFNHNKGCTKIYSFDHKMIKLNLFSEI